MDADLSHSGRITVIDSSVDEAVHCRVRSGHGPVFLNQYLFFMEKK